MKIGKARLYRQDVGALHRLQFRLMGLADPAHFLRSCYFKRYTRSLDPGRVLDAGCGRGDYSFFMKEYWPQAALDSVDLDPGEIERNKAVQKKWGLEGISFRVLDLADLDEEDTYDLIVCVDVMEHIVDQDKVLARFYKALRKGGYLFLHIPLKRARDVPLSAHLSKFFAWTEREHVAEEKTREQMLDMIRQGGFTVVNQQYTFYYWFGEMANSIFSIFFDDTRFSKITQGLVSPFTRLLCYAEMAKARGDGFALAVLAEKQDT